MTTTPFDPSVAQIVTQAHEQRLTAVALAGGQEYPLELEDWSVQLDENRSPRVDAVLVCAVPEEDVIEALDPRALVRVRLTVAYRLADGQLDEHDLFTLYVRVRDVNRPEDTMTLTCASVESILIDAAPATPFFEGVLLHDSTRAFVNAQLVSMTAGTPLEDLDVRWSAPDGPEFTYDGFPTDRWDGIRDAADSLDVSVYDNGDGILRIDPRRNLAGESRHILSHGENGTIIKSNARLDRDQWWNGVEVLWTWDNRTNPELPDRIWGQAYVTGGPLAPANAGYRTFTEQREGQVTDKTATLVAQTLMRRLLARSRTYTIDAVSAWWLRPEDTVTIQLPTGRQERHLVASVTFRSDGSMTLITRLPDSTTQIGE